MGQLIIKQDLKAGDTMDLLNQFFTSKIKITITCANGRIIEVGNIKDLEPTRNGIKGGISFFPGGHVRRMRGKNNDGFLFQQVNSKWVINKTE